MGSTARYYNVVLQNGNTLSSFPIRLGESLNFGNMTLVENGDPNPDGSTNTSGVTLLQSELQTSVNLPVFVADQVANEPNITIGVASFFTIKPTPFIQKLITMPNPGQLGEGIAVVERAGIYRIQASAALGALAISVLSTFQVQRAPTGSSTFTLLNQKPALIGLTATQTTMDFMVALNAGDQIRMRFGGVLALGVTVFGLTGGNPVSPTRLEISFLSSP